MLSPYSALLFVYDPHKQEILTQESSIMQIARIDAWLCTVVSCFSQYKKRGGHRQKLHADTLAKLCSFTTNQLVRHIRKFFRLWDPQEPGVPDIRNYFKRLKYTAIHIDKAESPVVNTGSTDNLALQYEWFLTYLKIELRHLSDCYISQVAKDKIPCPERLILLVRCIEAVCVLI